jgi:hypothetical protein
METNWSIHPAYGEDYGANIINEPEEYTWDETDSLTVDALMEVLDTDHPSLVFVNLQAVDDAGHSGCHNHYGESIRLADRAVERIWERIESDSLYQGKTTLIVTTDHGRHDPDKGGIRGHGGICNGCQHVMFLILGPDTPAEMEITRRTYQVDIAPTIGKLLGFNTPFSRGQVLGEAIIGYDEPDRFIVKGPVTDVHDSLVFIAWSDNRSGVDEVYFLGSYDSGQTFGDTLQLSNSGVAAIQPDITIDENGVHVIWMDLRNGIWGLYYRRSQDYGLSWDDERLLFSDIMEDDSHGSIQMWSSCIISEKGVSMIITPVHWYYIYRMFSYDGGDTWEGESIENQAYHARNVGGCFLDTHLGIVTSVQSRGNNWDVLFKREGFPESGDKLREWLSSDPSYSIQPVIDSNGVDNLYVACADNKSGLFQIFFREGKQQGSIWSNTDRVTGSPGGSWQPDLILDRLSGDVTLVWTDYRDDHGEIYRSHYRDQKWSPEERLTDTIGSVNLPNYAIDDNGNNFLVWEVVTNEGIFLGME